MRSIIFAARLCWFCAAPDAMFLRFDRKKHRPYLACEVCGTHAFFRTAQALTGMAIMTPLVEAMHDRMSTDASFAEAQRKAIVAFNTALLAAMQPPPAESAEQDSGATFREVLEQATKKVV